MKQKKDQPIFFEEMLVMQQVCSNIDNARISLSKHPVCDDGLKMELSSISQRVQDSLQDLGVVRDYMEFFVSDGYLEARRNGVRFDFATFKEITRILLQENLLQIQGGSVECVPTDRDINLNA